MAINRVLQSSVQSGLPKFDSVWDGTSAVGSMEAISAIVLTSTVNGFEFNNIPQTYSHLQIRMTCFNPSGPATTIGSLYLRLNGDTASNYNTHYLNAGGSPTPTLGKGGSANSTFMYAGIQYSAGTYFAANIIDILNYSNTNMYTTIRAMGGADNNSNGYIQFQAGAWRNSAAVTSIQFSDNASTFSLGQYSTISLYGIK